jgi:hypothetical protein
VLETHPAAQRLDCEHESRSLKNERAGAAERLRWSRIGSGALGMAARKVARGGHARQRDFG